MERVAIVQREFNPSIVGELHRLLEPGEAALAIIAPYRPLVAAPRLIIPPRIDYPEEFNVKEALDRIVEELDKEQLLEIKDGKEYIRRLYLLIQSPGGSVVSSFKVAKLIRDYAIEIITFIVHFAMSGGTLIALTGNKIVMGKLSHISPLDILLMVGDRFVSANDILRSFEFLTTLFEKIPEEHAPYPWKALAQQLDPLLVQEALNTNRLAEEYINRILRHELSSFKDVADRIIRRFVTGYPTHDYVIDCREFKEIADENKIICIEDISKDELEKNSELKKYQSLYKVFERWLGLYKDIEHERHIIRYYVKSKQVPS